MDDELTVATGPEAATVAGPAATVGWPGPVGEGLGYTSSAPTTGTDVIPLEAPGAVAVNAPVPVGVLELAETASTGGELLVVG